MSINQEGVIPINSFTISHPKSEISLEKSRWSLSLPFVEVQNSSPVRLAFEQRSIIEATKLRAALLNWVENSFEPAAVLVVAKVFLEMSLVSPLLEF